MKKIIFSLILMLFLINGVQANQESSIDHETLTIKSVMQLDTFDAHSIVIRSIKLIDDRYGNGKVVLDVEVIPIKGKPFIKQYEKNIKAGRDYYYEVVHEEAKESR